MTADSTHPSLLVRLRDSRDLGAWREFESRYGDLIVRYCFSRGLQPSDAEDVRQMVLISMSRIMPRFQYSPQRGTFRSYLGQVVRNAVTAFHRRQHPKPESLSILNIEAIAAPSIADEADAQWEAQWIAHHYRLAMQTIRATFEPKSVAVFERLLNGGNVHEIANDFQLSEPAVHKIKQRVRDRLREIIAQQLKDEDEAHDGRKPDEQ